VTIGRVESDCSDPSVAQMIVLNVFAPFVSLVGPAQFVLGAFQGKFARSRTGRASVFFLIAAANKP